MEGLQGKQNKNKMLWTIKSNSLSLKSKDNTHCKHKRICKAQFLTLPQFSTDLQGEKMLKNHPKTLPIYMTYE